MPGERRQPDRYEPLPGFLDLPGWLWRRTPRLAKVMAVVLLVVLVGVAVAIGPRIQRSKSEREQADQVQRTRERAAREAHVRRLQRPRFAAGAPATSGVPARERLLAAAGATVLDDARRRVAAGRLRGPVERVTCEPFPRSVAGVGAEDGTHERFGRYACLAVIAEFVETEETSGGLLGHPYRVRIDFDTGRYAYCKIAGRPAEGQLERDPGPTVPRVCGGGP